MTWSNPLPPLSTEELNDLTVDLTENGIRTPLYVAEDGDLLDGWHRKAIAEKFDLSYATEVITGLRSTAEKLAFALRVNVNRRNLSPDQRNEVRDKQKSVARTLKGEGFSLDRISALIGVPVSTLSRWLTGDSQVGNGGHDNRVKITPEQKQTIVKAKGQSQRQLAADLGISQQRISEIQQRHAKAAKAEVEAEIARAAKSVKAATVAKKFGIDEAEVKRIAEETAKAEQKEAEKAVEGAVATFIDLIDSLAEFGDEFSAALVGPTLVRRAEEDPGRYSVKDTVDTIEIVSKYLDDFIKTAANLSGTLKARRAK